MRSWVGRRISRVVTVPVIARCDQCLSVFITTMATYNIISENTHIHRFIYTYSLTPSLYSIRYLLISLQSFHRSLSNTHKVPGTTLGAGNSKMNIPPFLS